MRLNLKSKSLKVLFIILFNLLIFTGYLYLSFYLHKWVVFHVFIALHTIYLMIFIILKGAFYENVVLKPLKCGKEFNIKKLNFRGSETKNIFRRIDEFGGSY